MKFLERLSKFFRGAASEPGEGHGPGIHAPSPGPAVIADPAVEAALAAIRSSGASPRAIEAFWDGDTEGWFVVLSAACVTPKGEPLDLDLGAIRHGGDIRLFNGQVPPWPEAVSAQSVGKAVSAQLDIPFYFPSPVHPEEDCPRWRERQLGVPCGRCGVPLFQRAGCPWRGVCYQCHLKARFDARAGGGVPT